MILYVLMKECKCKTIVIKSDFYLGGGGFHNVFVIDKPNGPLQKKNHQNMHSQLINMDLQEGMVIKGM
jgi:hypothetical protein